jgi:DnaJ-class molecular chaperone
MEPIMAWKRPFDWVPNKTCSKCDGDGMGPSKTYNGDELVDWDDCERCGGTGDEPQEPTK